MTTFATRRTWLTRALSGLGAVLISRSGRAAEPAAAAPQAGFLQLGVNVTDIDRSTRFYVEAFGFTKANEITPDAKAGKIFGLGDIVSIRARILTLGGNFRLLLRQFDAPKYKGSTEPLGVTRPGLGDFALRIDNIERVTKLVRELGGNVVESSRVTEGTPEKPGPEVVFVTDPDGIRIELVQLRS